MKSGDVFLFYAIFYAIGRFFLEFLRLDPSPVAGINVNQMVMAVVGIGSAVILFLRHRINRSSSTPVENGKMPVHDASAREISSDTSTEESDDELLDDDPTPAERKSDDQ